MSLPAQVRIVEVGPRDGLQNESQPVSTEVKIELITRLAAAGLDCIEATAFVSPKWVPQMADHVDVLQRLSAGATQGVRHPVLVPNMQGLAAALAAGAREVAVFGAASEAFSRANINCSIAESLARFAPVVRAAREQGVAVRGYVSCAVGCPYQGKVAPADVAAIAGALHEMGCYQISLGDTIGVGTPAAICRMLEAVAGRVPIDRLAGHYHDTYGMAVANIHASLQMGVATFDSSIAGLGGCPYAAGAAGNVATEDVAYLLQGLGCATGLDLDLLAATGDWICGVLGRTPASKANLALAAQRVRRA